MTSYLITGALGTLIGCDSLWHYVFIWCMACIPFFTTLWEENATGYFYLPPINGVGEGAVAACVACHIMGFYKSIFMTKVNLFGMTMLLRDITVSIFFCFGVTFSVIRYDNLLNILKY